jgi:hypothetical protein
MSEYDEYDLLGLESDLLQEGDTVGAKTASECATTIRNLKDALEYIASGQSLDPVLFSKTFLEKYDRE